MLRQNFVERGGNDYEGQCIFCATGVVFQFGLVPEDVGRVISCIRIEYVDVLKNMLEKVMTVYSQATIANKIK
jgi:hypothetical protein